MPEQTRFRGSCESCGKDYRVPRADRTYTCKACGGTVSVPEPEGGVGAPRIQSKRRAQRIPRSEEDVLANQALADAYGAATAARSIMGFSAVLGLLPLILLMVGTAVAEDEDREGMLVVTSVLAVYVAVLAIGFFRIFKEPVLWSGLGALLITGILGLQLLGGRISVFTLLAVLSMWWATYSLIPAQRLTKEYPDLSYARMMSAKRDGAAGTSTALQRDARRRRSASKMANQGRLVGILCAAGVALAIAVAVFMMNRPQSFEPIPDRFADAWNATGPGAAQAYLRQPAAGLYSTVYAEDAAARGWEDSHPRIESTLRIRGPEKGNAAVVYQTAEGELTTNWLRVDKRWVMSGIRLPFGNLAERFTEAWNASDVPAVSRFFKDPKTTSVSRLLKKRKWDALPRITSSETAELSEIVHELSAETERGPLEVTFAFRDNRWIIRRLKPPKNE